MAFSLGVAAKLLVGLTPCVLVSQQLSFGVHSVRLTKVLKCSGLLVATCVVTVVRMCVVRVVLLGESLGSVVCTGASAGCLDYFGRVLVC